MASKNLYLIDGSGFIFRAFHALPPLTRPDGTPIGAVYGFTNMLLKLLEQAEADADLDYIAVIFDAARKTFRNEIYADYKAQRPDTPPDLIPQFSIVREATRACNVPAIELSNFEADDLIASYAKSAVADGFNVTVVSGDKDLMQLIDDKISLLDPIKNKKIGEAEVREKFGVAPNRVIDVQSLAGDSSDNVPGVPGIGVKTAAELINTYGDLDTLLARASEIKQPKRREALINNAEAARISRQLVTLKNDVPLPMPLADLIAKPVDKETLRAFLTEQGFKGLLSKLGDPRDAIDAKAAVSQKSAPTENVKKENISVVSPIYQPPSTVHYDILQTVEQLDAWLKKIRGFGFLAVDCETDSLSAVSANMIGISLSTEPGVACYIPLGHRLPDQGLDFSGTAKNGIQQIPIQTVIEKLKPILTNPAIMKIGHNIKFDLQVFTRYGIDITPTGDTMLMSYTLYGGQHGHGMDELAKKFLNYDTVKYDDVTGKGKSRITFDLVPIDKAGHYAAEDADITLRLYEYLKPRLVPEGAIAVYEAIERPLVPVMAIVESNGVRVDPARLRTLSAEFSVKIAELEKEIFKTAGTEFNIGSPKQMGEVLFEKMKLPHGQKTKTGAYSTDVGTMEDLAASGHVIAEQILSWRQLSKLKSTYADALVEEINPKTGRVHTSFHMALTNTGRLSSSDPNLQNIPVRTTEGKKIRSAFIAPAGHTLISADYSQIELRLMAEMANVHALKQAFAHGADIHAITASQIFHVPLENMDGDTRRRAKAINFGIIYGISAFGLAKQIGVGNNDAKQFIDLYFKRYPEIRDYMESQKQFARDHLYVETLFGRKCFMPEINNKNAAIRNFAERQAINAPLQGTAADIIKRAMIHAQNAITENNWPVKMLLQVHDELVFEAPEGEAEIYAPKLQSIMQNAASPAVKLSVPLNVDLTIEREWS